MQRRIRHVIKKAFLGGVCAAAALCGAGSFAAAAQMAAGTTGSPQAQPYGTVAGNPQHGKAVAEEKCASCHGADGNSADPKFPKLAGQNAAYLYRQLWAFKTGTRRSAIMSGILAPLPDDDLADAASFYAEQKARPDPVKDKALIPAGERIFFAGAGRAMGPPCAMCHGSAAGPGMPMMGMMGNGMGPAMMALEPNLSGQHAAYILGQLHRFASGERRGLMMGMMMGPIARALSERDKKAVAAYLSGLP